MTDRFTHDAAPYVLGALAPEERRAFEAHLAGCTACEAEVRGFAGLPGLLSRLPSGEVPTVFGDGEDDRPAPPSLLAPLLQRARAERRRRRWRALAAGAAAVCLAAAGSAVVAETVERAPAQQQAVGRAFARASADIPVSAEATVTEVPGGTRIDMTCRYSGKLDGRIREYVLRVVPKAGGEPERLGSWPVLTTDDYRVTVVAPLPRDRIGYFEVVNATGRTLLTLPV